jgi:hypothetical protein
LSARGFLERGLPGAFGYFNARTQYFDEVLLQEVGAGLQQVVILGAGFDSRSIRFEGALQGPQVFEVDLPEVSDRPWQMRCHATLLHSCEYRWLRAPATIAISSGLPAFTMSFRCAVTNFVCSRDAK